MCGGGSRIRKRSRDAVRFVMTAGQVSREPRASAVFGGLFAADRPRGSQACNAVRGGDGFAESAVTPVVPAGNLAAARFDMIGRVVHPGLADDNVRGPDRDTLPTMRAAGEVAAPYLFTLVASSGIVCLFLTRTC